MNGADTAWIIVATALVLMMTLPGLALFYGGLVRARNVLSVFMHCYAIACLMSFCGLSLAIPSPLVAEQRLLGRLGQAVPEWVTADSLSGTLPEVLFFAFQMTFAIITPALIVGAYVERIGFGFVLLFSAFGCCCAMRRWCTGSGAAACWPMAASLVKRVSGISPAASWCTKPPGSAALILAVFLGPRRNQTTPPHSPGMVMMGAACSGSAGSASMADRNWPQMGAPPWR